MRVVPERAARAARRIAMAVHLTTASGAAFALAATLAAIHGTLAAAFAYLGGALVVDAIDGPLARRFDVAAHAPRWSGATLDLVVDYTTYVFVPVLILVAASPFGGVLDIGIAGLIATSAAIYFADTEMKTDENGFKGFPAAWNVAIFEVLTLQPPPWLGAGALLVFVALQFAPMPFLHPVRVRRLRPLTWAFAALWSGCAVLAIADDLAPSAPVRLGLALGGLYFVLAGVLKPGKGR